MKGEKNFAVSMFQPISNRVQVSDFLEPNLHAGATFDNSGGKEIEKGNFFSEVSAIFVKKSFIFKLKYL